LIHFFIHATEMDGVGAEALPYAEKLAALAPAASHLVHMPSHVYFRVGRYRDAEKANLDAVAIDAANAARLKPEGGVFALGYHEHNVMYAAAAALLSNDRDTGIMLAQSELQQLPGIKPDQTFRQFGLGAAYAVVGRFGTATEVASLPEPGATLPYVVALWHYGRGELAARADDRDAIRRESTSISLSAQDSEKLGDLSPQASAMVDIARLVLTGRLAMLESRWSEAEAAYRKAAELQEARLGTIMDPPAWWYPLRRSVAAALLAQGNARAAKIEAQQALDGWPNDPLSLRVLADCDRALGETAEEQAAMIFAGHNWTGPVESVPLSQI
jgi:tetratricopeptide (TPR) repeat protein